MQRILRKVLVGFAWTNSFRKKLGTFLPFLEKHLEILIHMFFASSLESDSLVKGLSFIVLAD